METAKEKISFTYKSDSWLFLSFASFTLLGNWIVVLFFDQRLIRLIQWKEKFVSHYKKKKIEVCSFKTR